MLSILLNVFVKLTNVLSKSAASSSLSDVGLARCGTWILWPLLWIFFNGGRLLCQFGQLGQLGHAFSFTGDSVCCWASSLYLCGNHICLPNVPQPTLFLRSNLTKTLSDVADPPLFTLSRCAQAIFRCCWSTSGEGSQSSPSLSPSLGSPSLYLLSLRSLDISQITFLFNIYHLISCAIHHDNLNIWMQNKAAKNGLIYVAKNTVSACFGIVFIYTAELLPTCVRWM